MAEKIENTTNWPDLAISLYDRLTGRGSEITYEFDNMEVAVPSSASVTASLDGPMKTQKKASSRM